MTKRQDDSKATEVRGQLTRDGAVLESSLSCFFFKGLPLWHMEIPRLGVNLELQRPAYTTATATRDPSRVCNLHYSSWQRRIVNPTEQGQGPNPQLHGS